MKERKLQDINISPAPTAWRYLPLISEQYRDEWVLHRIDGTRLCAWYFRAGLVWERKSDLFLVSKDGKR